MNLGDLVGQNLGSPAVLAFVLGAVAVRLKSDLRFPESITSLLSTYLLLAIGLKGGLRLREASFDELSMPVIATIVLGILTPSVAYLVARRFLKLSISDAAAMAAHYGSVSAVTFTAAEAADIADRLGTPVVVVKAQIHAGGRGKGNGSRNPSRYSRDATAWCY